MERLKFFIVIPVLHIVALLGLLANPWLIFPAIIAYVIIHTLGQNVGYHKLFSHNAFEPKPWYPYVAAFFGSISFVGDPLTWSLVHRMHHAYADTELDPHSPNKGRFHAYIGWTRKFNPSIRHYKLVSNIVKQYTWTENFRKWELMVPLVFYSCLYFVSVDLFYVFLIGSLLSLHSGLAVNAFAHSNGPRDNQLFARFFHTICFHADHHNSPNKFDYSQQGVTDFSRYILKLVSK